MAFRRVFKIKPSTVWIVLMLSNVVLVGMYAALPTMNMAASMGRVGPMKFRLLLGGNVNSTDQGVSPLQVASERGQYAAVAFLVSKGADVNFTDLNGDTALHLAARNGNGRIAHFLIEHGANPRMENAYHSSPSEEAKNHGHHKLAIELDEKPGETQGHP